jgi:hypothetical protein
MRWFLAVVLSSLMAVPAQAITQEDGAVITPEMMPLPKAKEGAIAWQDFLTTTEKSQKIVHPDGGYSFAVEPVFHEKIKALAGKEITIFGFMFPLEQSEKQAHFLIGPYPPSCPFHYHVPPSLIIEIKSKEPVEFSWDEIGVRGTLELAGKDSNGIYYTLKDAVIVR